VDAPGEPVGRLGRAHDPIALGVGAGARVGEGGEGAPVLLEPREHRVVGDGGDEHLAPLVARAEREEAHAWGAAASARK
jgi:hypothetical protein